MLLTSISIFYFIIYLCDIMAIEICIRLTRKGLRVKAEARAGDSF